jgi:hypothetical protein
MREPDRARRHILSRGLVYFALVFGTGFVLGPVRVLWLVPLVGERAAELIEAPFMLAAIFLSARFVVRRQPALRPSGHLASGLFALLLVVTLELTVVLWLRGQTLGEYLAQRDLVGGSVYVGLLALFGLMPWWLGRATT